MTSQTSTSTTGPGGDLPVSNRLAQRLIEVADDAGYGPADTTFVLLMADVCLDVQSGFSSWDELIGQDAADGAPRADAERFNHFLRDEFCPNIAAPTEEPQPQGDTEAPSDGTRGVGSTVSYLDATWEHASLANCRAATGTPIGEPLAYQFEPGVLVCATYLEGGPWDDTLINLDVVFDPSVSESTAQDVALRLLPEDTQATTRHPLTNPDWSAHDGTCVGLGFQSSTLETAILTANPDWTEAEAASATLYSDKQTDYGSSSAFDGTVHVMSLGTGVNVPDSNC